MALDPDLLGDIRGWIMVTRERIRFLLIHNKYIRANILRARTITIEMESDSDVIEASIMQATDYARDKVQTTSEPHSLTMSSIKRERFKQREDVSMRNFIIDAQEAEIEHLDCAVFQLLPIPQNIVILRFYDSLTAKEICSITHYSKRNVIRITNKAIDDIAEIFNSHEAASPEGPRNNIAAKLAPHVTFPSDILKL